MNDKGYIRVHRRLIDWEWYKDTNTKVVFLHCLLKANWKDGRFQGYEIPRGSFATSLNNLANELSSENQKFSIQSVRTALKHLELTNELTIKTTNKFTIISIKNYNLYQEDNTEANKQLTNNQQTTNKQLTTIEKYKKEKNIKKVNIKENTKRKVFAKPTIDEINNYCLERNNGIDAEAFFNFYESKDWYVGKNKMKDWQACIRTWEKRDVNYKTKNKAESFNKEDKTMAILKGVYDGTIKIN